MADLNNSEIDDSAYITIDDLDPSTGVAGTDTFYGHKTDGSDNQTTAAQLKEYCTPPAASKNNAGLVDTGAQAFAGRKEFQQLAYTGRTSVGAFVYATCDTAAATENKEIGITNYGTLDVGDIIGVTFTNANTFGDCTLDTPTYPKLVINSSIEMKIQNGGKTVGTGAWGAGDYIEFRIINAETVEILNSDIRQSVSGTSGYTIYRNGNFGMLPYSKTYQASESGTTYTISNLTKYKTISINYTWGGSYNTPGNTSFVLSMVQFVNNGYLTIIDTTNSSYYVTVSLISDTQIKVKGTSSYVYALITLL